MPSVLSTVTSRDRAWAFALLWLLVLTIVNVQTGGAHRSTLLYAMPVVLVAWTDWRLGFVYAALCVVAAWYGGAMPEPGSTGPLWLDAMLAFIKLSVDAAVVHAWGRRFHRRTAQDSQDNRPRRGRP